MAGATPFGLKLSAERLLNLEAETREENHFLCSGIQIHILCRLRLPLRPILQFRPAAGARAMDTTKDLRALLDAVPHDSAAATRTGRRQRVNGAFETVEDVRLTSETDFERFVVIVPTHFALGHIDRSFRVVE
jgi:hypothetical protein